MTTTAEIAPAAHLPTSVAEHPVRPESPPPASSSGTIWLIVGGLITATAIGVLAPMAGLGLPVAAVTGIVVIGALYAVMILVRLLVRTGRLRLRLLVVDLACIALVAVVSLTVITAIEWSVLG